MCLQGHREWKEIRNGHGIAVHETGIELAGTNSKKERLEIGKVHGGT